MWYYYVCKREVWFMARELHPNQEDTFLEIGRLIHENVYIRKRKEIKIANTKIDLIRKEKENYIVGEIKKSSRYLLPSKMQLIFYLYQLKRQGIDLKGELMIPKERKRIAVELNKEYEEELKSTIKEIREIINKDKPPEGKKVKWCRRCAYNEFCWAEV
jgi:CRISPR-associated exonuclease Cas4